MQADPDPYHDVVDAHRHQITAAQLAVDGEVEQRQVTRSAVDFHFRRIDQTWLTLSGGFGPTSLSLFHGGDRGAVFGPFVSLSFMTGLLVEETCDVAGGDHGYGVIAGSMVTRRKFLLFRKFRVCVMVLGKETAHAPYPS